MPHNIELHRIEFSTQLRVSALYQKSRNPNHSHGAPANRVSLPTMPATGKTRSERYQCIEFHGVYVTRADFIRVVPDSSLNVHAIFTHSSRTRARTRVILWLLQTQLWHQQTSIFRTRDELGHAYSSSFLARARALSVSRVTFDISFR